MALTADVAIAGGGAIGLCAALALAERGLKVIVVTGSSIGEASRAAAGMLAPSIERASADPDEFGIAARDRYPSYLDYLRDSTGIAVALNRQGILQAALTPSGVKGLRRSAPTTSRWLDRDELVRLEPALSHALGAVYNPLDGSVDNVALMDALVAAVEKHAMISPLAGRVLAVTTDGSAVIVATANGNSVSAAHFVVAAGAWAGSISGAKLAASVTPSKGQLVEFGGA
ncbi:MAG: FAD-binding oxidoreductase, partial [Gemmatimonadota bacterium]|nr:FAD-binding oxidoreductase [Gemmatimonadota bacterium]